jgi:tRNA dimethylallyltransferase
MMSDMNPRKAIVVIGPTAVGKSAAALALASRYGGEIVSADSMQVYRGLDKGTAKPSDAEKKDVTHHMIDVADPHANYSVAAFAQGARAVIEDIFSRGKVPIVCGGSGLYVNALIYDMDFAGAAATHGGTSDSAEAAGEGAVGGMRDAKSANPLFPQPSDIMENISATAIPDLYRTLVRKDPLAAWSIHPNNTKRVLRALERLNTEKEQGGVRSFEASFIPTTQFSPILLRLTMDRETLCRRINERVDGFLAAGLAEEVQSLLDAGVGRNTTAMQGIGYKEIAACLAGERTMAEAVEQIKRNTRRFAKRQETWFRRYPGVRVVEVADGLPLDTILVSA